MTGQDPVNIQVALNEISEVETVMLERGSASWGASTVSERFAEASLLGVN